MPTQPPAPGPGASYAEALAAISCTLHRYAFAVDEMDRAMLMDTFMPQACLEATVAHGAPVPRLEGPAAIADFILSGRQAQGDRRRHVVTNLWLADLATASATAHSYHAILVSSQGAAQLRSIGIYRDDMLRCGDGVWRCLVKRVMLDAPY